MRYFILFNPIFNHPLDTFNAKIIIQVQFGPVAVLDHVGAEVTVPQFPDSLHERQQPAVGLIHFVDVVLGKELAVLGQVPLFLTAHVGLRNRSEELRVEFVAHSPVLS